MLTTASTDRNGAVPRAALTKTERALKLEHSEVEIKEREEQKQW